MFFFFFFSASFQLRAPKLYLLNTGGGSQSLVWKPLHCSVHWWSALQAKPRVLGHQAMFSILELLTHISLTFRKKGSASVQFSWACLVLFEVS